METGQNEEDSRYVELFDQLGRSRDPIERTQLAQELSRLTFGS